MLNTAFVYTFTGCHITVQSYGLWCKTLSLCFNFLLAMVIKNNNKVNDVEFLVIFNN